MTCEHGEFPLADSDLAGATVWIYDDGCVDVAPWVHPWTFGWGTSELEGSA